MKGSLFTKVINEKDKQIDQNNIHSHFSHMVQDLICQICLNIVYPYPVKCKECNKMYCKACIDEWKSKNTICPNYSHKFEETPLDNLAKSFLNNVRLLCENKEKGCPESVLYGDYTKHISECWYSKWRCEGCKLEAFKSIIEKHVNQCESFYQKCPDCGTRILKNDITEHSVNCPDRLVACVSCKINVKYKDLKIHDDACLEKQIVCKHCKDKYARKNSTNHTWDICVENIKKSYEVKLKLKDLMIKKLKDEQTKTSSSSDILGKKTTTESSEVEKALNLLPRSVLLKICISNELKKIGNKEILVNEIINRYGSDLKKLTNDILKDICFELGVNLGGNKDDLIERIQNNI